MNKPATGADAPIVLRAIEYVHGRAGPTAIAIESINYVADSRLRKLQPGTVDAIAASIKDVGQLEGITWARMVTMTITCSSRACTV